MELKRKTPLQLQALENFYSEETCPTPKAIKGYVAVTRLTYKQVRGWFVERRRRDRRDGELGDVPLSKIRRRCLLSVEDGSNTIGFLKSRCKHLYSALQKRVATAKRMKMPYCHQDMLFSPDHILKKVLRKDGPALGVEFDALPAIALSHGEADSQSNVTCTLSARQAKRRKVHHAFGVPQGSMQLKGHGIGKGLMAVWRLTNPDAGDFPTGLDSSSGMSISGAERPSPRIKKKREQSLARKLRQREIKAQKKKPLLKRGKESAKQDKLVKQTCRVKCGFALNGVTALDNLERCAISEDDEELELREHRAGANPLSGCDHCTSSIAVHSCSLCKDVLVKFPPSSVKMRKPFSAQPWDSSFEMVKKLFKAFHFVYTYAVFLEVDPFTLDEFAQAFHDKDSLILGKVHLALLKLLIHYVESELDRNYFGHLHKSCKLLALLRSVENHTNLVEFWKKALNPLTWSEILCQVMVAAGFGSNEDSLQRETMSKEMSQMMKYGLRPATLKGELFRLLLRQDNCGLRISEMMKCPQILDLKISEKMEELEDAIYSTLSSDITLFEKISPSAYRLRVNYSSRNAEYSQSDTEDSGTVDNQCDDMDTDSDESDCDTEALVLRKFKPENNCQKKDGKGILNIEIDESHPGEAWLLGLMEGEYSGLSIDEKLDALVGVVDLLSVLSSIMFEHEPSREVPENITRSMYFGSGAKIKKASTDNSARETWVHNEKRSGVDSSKETRPVDSLVLLSKLHNKESAFSKLMDAEEMRTQDGLHPMQSVYLGSDRRYNQYWLFLGPCTTCDPGHRRVYFESSEDGHWEVMDSAEAFCSLLSVLDNRGVREAVLIDSLEVHKCLIVQAMSESALSQVFVRPFSGQTELEPVREQSYSPVSDVDNNSALSTIDKDYLPWSRVVNVEVGKKGGSQRHLKEFDSWIWNSFYVEFNAVKHRKRPWNDALKKCEKCHDLYWRDEKHCKVCHTTFELNFDLEEKYAIHAATCGEEEETDVPPNHKILSSQLQSLKAACYAIESAMPENALIGAWRNCAHKIWTRRLRRTSSIAELLQVLADFVHAINRDWLLHCSVTNCDGIFGEEIVTYFSTIPQTSSAIALWLIKLDTLVGSHMQTMAHGTNCG